MAHDLSTITYRNIPNEKMEIILPLVKQLNPKRKLILPTNQSSYLMQIGKKVPLPTSLSANPILL